MATTTSCDNDKTEETTKKEEEQNEVIDISNEMKEETEIIIIDDENETKMGSKGNEIVVNDDDNEEGNDDDNKEEKEEEEAGNEEEEEEEMEEEEADETNEESWKNDDFLSFGAEPKKGNETAPNNNNNNNKRRKTDNTSSKVDREEEVKENDGNNNAIFGDFSDASRYFPASVELPPWMESHSSSSSSSISSIPKLVLLHNEIVDFANLMSPREDEIQEREELIQRFINFAKHLFGSKCKINVFGSQATGLFLPTSDIDLVIILENHETSINSSTDNNQDPTAKVDEAAAKIQDQKEMDEWNMPKGTPLIQLAEALRADDHWNEDLSYLEVIENTRIPIVKFTHAPTNLSFDVSFNQDTGPLSASLVTTLNKAMPPLRPLTFVLKYFMAARELNEPYNGGIGSFSLQMMIVSFLQQRERQEYSQNRSSIGNLGALLLDFFELYGLDFNYFLTGITIRHDGSYFPKGDKQRRPDFWHSTRPYSLALENPLEPTSDACKSSFRINIISKAYESAFKVLLLHVTEPSPPLTVSILASILPPTPEMFKRAARLRVFRTEQRLLQQKQESDSLKVDEPEEGEEHV